MAQDELTAKQPRTVAHVQSVPLRPRRPAAVAVTGLACRTAAGATSSHLWRLLLSGGCELTRAIPQRWRVACSEAGAPEEVRLGGFIELSECQTDPTRWGFSAVQAHRMDLHLTLLIHTMLRAVCDAQLAGEDVLKDRRGQVGVFTACTTSEFIHALPSYFVARTAATALQVCGRTDC